MQHSPSFFWTETTRVQDKKTTTTMLTQNTCLAQYVASPIWTRYTSKISLILGVAQLMSGILTIISLSVMAIVAKFTSAFVYFGILEGVFCILIGAIGVAAGRQRTTWSIMTYMALSMLAPVFIVSIATIFFPDSASNNEYRGKLATPMEAVTVVALSVMMILEWFCSSCIFFSSVFCGCRLETALSTKQVMMGADDTELLLPAGSY